MITPASRNIVVADTTPLIVLSESGYAWLLEALFEEIVAPDAVWRELETGIERPNRRALLETPWLSRRRAVGSLPRVSNSSQLDPGETEAMILALELKASIILIDERAGRSAATELALPVLGTVGRFCCWQYRRD